MIWRTGIGRFFLTLATFLLDSIHLRYQLPVRAVMSSSLRSFGVFIESLCFCKNVSCSRTFQKLLFLQLELFSLVSLEGNMLYQLFQWLLFLPSCLSWEQQSLYIARGRFTSVSICETFLAFLLQSQPHSFSWLGSNVFLPFFFCLPFFPSFLLLWLNALSKLKSTSSLLPV